MNKALLAVFVLLAVAVAGPLRLSSQAGPSASPARAEQARLDRIPHADLGNGYYRNPVLVGPGGDNTVVRVGRDFYMHAGSDLIWHSRDLVNWRPLVRVPGAGAATDILFHNGKYYMYSTRTDPSRINPEYKSLSWSQRTLLGAKTRATGNREMSTVVLWANDPAGPWNGPTEIGLYGMIDPGHIADPKGNRYLYANKGIMVQLAPDGLSAVGELKTAYEGWQYPKDWVVECFCLEAPKLLYRNGYYYMASAQGGTSGPSTAHMEVVARSKSVDGPWENSPHNPLVRAQSRQEKWWRQGHGTFVDDAEGNWWFLYTGYENGYAYLGKQSLLLPVEWTADGWPRIKPGVTPTDTIRKPAGEDVGHGMPLSDDFAGPALGIQWTRGRGVNTAEAVKVGGGRLTLRAGGTSATQATSLSIMPVNHAYEVDVEVTVPDTAEGGLLIGGAMGGGDYVTAGLKKGEAFAYWPRVPNAIPWKENRIFVRIRYDHTDVSCAYSADGNEWNPFENSTAVNGARSLSLYAAGQGEVTFRNFKYRGLD